MSGGVVVGLDVILYLVSVMVIEELVNQVVQFMQLIWIKGIVVDGFDV